MTRKKPYLFWPPRILGILFAGFISLFALDVFGDGYTFWETIAGFLIHLIPTGLIGVALVVAWHREKLGALLFAILGLWYLVISWGRMDWLTYLLIPGPLFLISLLFFIDWRVHSRREKYSG